MKPTDFKQLKELIQLYGSAQFWRGANNEYDAIYDRLTVSTQQYYQDIISFLEKL